MTEVGLRINGGFFVMNRRVFDYLLPGEDVMNEPAQRMVAAGQLGSYDYRGFWACMDTFKEKQLLEDIYQAGEAPWEVWRPAVGWTGDGLAGDPLVYGDVAPVVHGLESPR